MPRVAQGNQEEGRRGATPDRNLGFCSVFSTGLLSVFKQENNVVLVCFARQYLTIGMI